LRIKQRNLRKSGLRGISRGLALVGFVYLPAAYAFLTGLLMIRSKFGEMVYWVHPHGWRHRVVVRPGRAPAFV